MKMYELFSLALEEYGIKNLKLKFEGRILSDPIEVLDIKERSMNCLKRAKFKTIGEILDDKRRLVNSKGCGITTIKDVNAGIIKRHLSQMTEEDAKKWIAETIITSN